ncbi:adenylate kinase [Methylacidimicrobium cyclopophantes]|uniref:Adenylate kinase n=1 Tax=Methylacidimicrobium cyclopophantes TaxID=1041766 RepID=A0A5E6MFD8_9BACT|nr:nucleoside monophosphate kinase [Methylacidimicrobium cyclopophantes]VVM07950.1 adenylate kinase [Methylacidimicrobium cyclopophantes]
MKFRSLLLLGAPGSGKGTQGQILAQIPGFVHLSSGDLFRSLDPASDLGKLFRQYADRGQLAPDELTIRVWRDHVQTLIASGRYRPATDFLVLDGIPRNANQLAQISVYVDILHVFHLSCPDRDVLIQRLAGRAHQANRTDDVDPKVILRRISVYETETKPLLGGIPQERIHDINADQLPYQVLRQILQALP